MMQAPHNTTHDHSDATRREVHVAKVWHRRAQLVENAPVAPKLLCLRPAQREDGSRRERAHWALRRAREPASTTAHPTPTPAPQRSRRRRKRT